MKIDKYFLIILLAVFFSCKKQENIELIKKGDNELSEVEHTIDKMETIDKFVINETIGYVNSIEGLRVRKAPEINSEIIYLLRHREKVNILEIGSKANIDKIEGNWVLIETINTKGWVFNGYLVSEENFNIFEDAGKKFEIIKAGYFIIEKQHESNEIEIILSDENFDLNFPEFKLQVQRKPDKVI
jgi:hypothetical protein